MKNNRIILLSMLIIIFMIVCLIFGILKLFYEKNIDTDYKKLGIEIKDYEIEYYTVYYEEIFRKYKVYKIKNYYSDSMEKFKQQLEGNELWNRDKFYEYIMNEFYEIIDDEACEIDRDNLYYYNKNDIYAIFDIKNAKLYYIQKNIYKCEQDYNNILGINVKDCISKEIYNVRGGLQNDGTDYYTYEFTKVAGNSIDKLLKESKIWKKEKLSKDILDCFIYNDEVNLIQNGYYYYREVYRTSDKNITQTVTGYEVGVFDLDENILYYYWTSI